MLHEIGSDWDDNEADKANANDKDDDEDDDKTESPEQDICCCTPDNWPQSLVSHFEPLITHMPMATASPE